MIDQTKKAPAKKKAVAKAPVFQPVYLKVDTRVITGFTIVSTFLLAGILSVMLVALFN